MIIGSGGWKKEKILVIVKAYPQPSHKYGEAVCTAGLTEKGSWIRIYPVEFRELAHNAQFEKWQWIEAKIKKSSDPRPESYKIDYDSIVLGNKIHTTNQWQERRRYVENHNKGSLEDLEELHTKHGTSLGLIIPRQVNDFIAEPVDPEWEPDKLSMLKLKSGTNLFSSTTKAIRILEKVPYKFSYKFYCNHSKCNGHKLQILDWEVAQSFRKWKKQYKSEHIALDKMRQKYLIEFQQKDLSFILGTIRSMDRFGTFSIIGLFYPPKKSGQEQLTLFT